MLSLEFYDKFKIPEGVRVPVLGGLLYNYITKLEQKKARQIYENLDESKRLNPSRSPELIVSLTSFPQRIQTIAYSLATLFNQTLAPDRIILWLAKEQFEDREVPNNLEKLVDLGLEIKFCDEDLKGHKKYFYTLQEFPEAVVVTVDDDLIYTERFLEKLYKSYKQRPSAIHCHRCQEMMVSDGLLLPYNHWKILSKQNPQDGTLAFMPSTGGGTLYPPHIFDSETFDSKKIKQFALTADDIWMRFMSLRKGIKVVKISRYHRPFSVIAGSQTVSLAQTNIFENQNNLVIQNLVKEYPEAVDKLCRTQKSQL